MMIESPGKDKLGPRVLVLMATYNGAQWVGAQLRSIFVQQGVHTSIVIRDDASSDETATIVSAVCAGRSDVTLLHAPSSSGSAAGNFFALMSTVDASEYDFISLADQDDVWEAGKLAHAVASLTLSGADCYSAAVKAFWPDGRTAILAQTSAQTSADYLFEGCGQGCTFVMRAAFFARVQRTLTAHATCLRRLHYHDWVLYALCRLEGGRWVRDGRVSVQYRQHDANDTGARNGMAGIGKRLEKIRSGWYGQQIVGISQLCVAIVGDEAVHASHYLRCHEQAQRRITGRIALLVFVWKHGRRRVTDRLVLAWAALSGHLTR